MRILAGTRIPAANQIIANVLQNVPNSKSIAKIARKGAELFDSLRYVCRAHHSKRTYFQACMLDMHGMCVWHAYGRSVMCR